MTLREPAAPTVAFRVDSGAHLGSGHVMRCVALALELRSRGAHVFFVSRPHTGHISARVEADGFEAVLLAGSAEGLSPSLEGKSTTLGASQARDAQETLEAIGKRSVDWVVADHYGVGSEWEIAVRSSSGAKLLVIDDLANRPHHADALLDQNFFGPDTQYRYLRLIPEDCVALLGPRFALLPAEYALMRRVLPRRSGIPRRVLVAFGGSDATNETASAMAALSLPEFSALAVDIVLGPNHPAPETILEAAGGRPGTTVYRSLPSLAGLIARADYSIGAAGSTTLERLSLSLPAAVVTVAGNQVEPTRALASAGYVRWIGSAPISAEACVGALSEIGLSVDELPPLVDGLGAKRVAEVLCPSTVGDGVVRRARADDAGLFFDWRNDPAAREQSFSEDLIAWSSHQQWFEAKLAGAATEIFVGESRGLPIGQVRLDFDGGEGVLSYSVEPTVRGRGWGGWLVSEVTKRASRRGPRVIRAFVRPTNRASRSIFTRLGWQETVEGDGRIAYRWS